MGNPADYNASQKLHHNALKALGWWPFLYPDGEPLVAEVKAFQNIHGLVADGSAGPSVWAKLRELYAPAGWLRRVPNGYSEANGAYGDPHVVEASGGRVIVAPEWQKASIVSAKLHTGHSIQLHSAVAAEFCVLFQLACSASGYTPQSIQTFVPRHKLWDPQKPLSIHTYGAAVDFDPSQNHMGATTSPLQQHPEFGATFRAAGWVLGMDWAMLDVMHFQMLKGA